MSRRISIRPDASLDIDRHVDYLLQNNPEAAMRFFDAARQTFATLARIPSMGRVYREGEDATQDIRKWTVKGFKNYIILYRFDSTLIEIIRVPHAAQDIDRFLEAE